MSNDCIFCKIIAKEIPGELLFQDERVTAFRDIQPIAPIHILIVPNKHIPSMNEVSTDDAALIGYMHLVAQKLAKDEGVAESGYRLTFNTGDDGGQVVYHLHLHLMGGKRFHTRLE